MNQTEFKKLFAKNLRRVMAEREKKPVGRAKGTGRFSAHRVNVDDRKESAENGNG